jgi:hypothetical protein
MTHLDKQSQKIAKSKSKNGKIKKVKRTASLNKKTISASRKGALLEIEELGQQTLMNQY